jgi:predicted RNA binding protein YcfA (HicA-like mRNA interferase family)
VAPSTDFSGRDIVKALTKNSFYIVDRTGSHVKLRYEHPTNADDIRVVTVPMHDRINRDTLQSIATQSGANDFRDWCEWIAIHC